METVCCNPGDISFHFPLVVQTNLSPSPGYLSNLSGTTFRRIERVFSLTQKSGNKTFYLSVRPCVPIEDPDFLSTLQHTIRKYIVPPQSRASLARIDSSMRKVAAVPDCNGTQPLRHSETRSSPVLRDAPFFVLSRDSGYPPRQG